MSVRNTRTSDKRPLTTSSGSTLTYDTVPVDLCTVKETREPNGGDTASENHSEMETEGKQISKDSTSAHYETLQHEQLEIKNGCTMDKDKGKSFEFDPTQRQVEVDTQHLEQSDTDHTGLGGADKPWRKRIIHGSGYENVSSPDVRQLHVSCM